VDANASLRIALSSELHDSLICVQRAQDQLRHFVGPHRDAVVRELVAAQNSLSRALTLVGGE
jgi:capsule polysaccharide export protein KpsE/RkpR